MKPRTRNTGAGKATTNATADSREEARSISLAPSDQNPPRVLILPKDLSPEARITTVRIDISDDRTEARRYLVCPERGFFEFTKIAAPKRACRSWLLADETPASTLAGSAEACSDEQEAYVLQSPDLLVATPLDPLYLLLACKEVLWPNHVMGNPEYLSLDTRLGMLRTQQEHLDQVMRDDTAGRLEQLLLSRVTAVCDVQEIPGEEMEATYCLSLVKLQAELLRAAKRAVDNGLPASMEEQFVRQALLVPELGIRREGSGISAVDGTEANPETVSQSTSQATDTSNDSTESASTAATSLSTTSENDAAKSNDASETIKALQRIRTVMQYMMAAYLPGDLRQSLQAATVKQSAGQTVDFQPLDDHLAYIASLKKEAQALRSLSDNISRKRSAFDDEEAMERAEAKKRKKEEDDFKKKNTSRGVQQLAKVNTSGMQKLSAFFAKAPAKKK